ncbi:MAG: M1 family metallopeptidase [Acidimicrobiales bacterium]
MRPHQPCRTFPGGGRQQRRTTTALVRLVVLAVLAGLSLAPGCRSGSDAASERATEIGASKRTVTTPATTPATPASTAPTPGRVNPDPTRDGTGRRPPADGSDPDGVGDAYFPRAGNRGIDVLSVDLQLDWTPGPASSARAPANQPAGTFGHGGTLAAVADLRLAITAARQGVQLDLVGLQVRSARLDDAEVPFEQRDGELIIAPALPFQPGGQHRVVVAYGGDPVPVPDPSGFGIGLGWVAPHAGDGAYVASEPVGAPNWFPTNDHPTDKMLVRLAVTVPDAYEVMATGSAGDREAGPRAGSTTWRFEPRDPMAAYLLSVAIGRFDLINSPASGSGVPVRSAVPEGRGGELASRLEPLGAMIDVFSAHFGPYPFEVYGTLVVNEKLGYALENQTLSLFGLDTVQSEAKVAHELAHQWFGNSVSVHRWADIWLNEGPATYAEWLWDEANGVDINARAALEWSELKPADSGAIANPGVAGLFGTAVYQRGALTLHALRRTVGDQAFFAILQTWNQRFRHGSASTADFVALSSELAGLPLEGFFQRWLGDPVMPDLPE